MKLILVSVKGTIVNPEKKVVIQVAKQLGALAAELHQHGVKVALWSNQAWTCNGQPLHEYIASIAGVPIYAHGYQWDNSPARKRKDSAASILNVHGAKRYETILLGGGDDDFICGVNNKLLHIRSDWYGQNSDHGFQVKSVEEFRRFCVLFGLRQHNLFWQASGSDWSASTAGPFSTQIQAYALFGFDARDAAKKGTGHPDFWFYITVASLYFSGLMEDVDYICTYPGHDAAPKVISNSGLESILARLGKCTRADYFHDLVVRHTTAPKSQYTKAADRLFTNQLSTIKLNKYPHRNLSDTPRKTPISLKGKRVLIVDDMVTSGRSIESARAYIAAAGASSRLFGWLKTISTSYLELPTPPKSLKPFEANTFSKEPPSTTHSYAGGIVAAGAPTELDDILKRFVAWKL
ncbi:phosphoribosyltransferase family protein [uncultured Stenotrophomonas sp.]|uniref:phosphoribosyltransferase family protein n=1 Tax=uncultured Stenotrophomonas sp. TaxID=165438 RepID=UPI0028D4822B|nr:phosphoribosyltransferase family protein [uncultured Stenotrophomonas sp.]